MLYFASQFHGIGMGTLTYMKVFRDEDDDGFPEAITIAPEPASVTF